MITLNNKKIADAGFYINLSHRIDRKNHIENELKRVNLNNVNRFEAYYSNKKNETSRNGSRMTHYELMKHIVQNGYEKTLIIEDDIEFTEYFNLETLELMNQYIDNKMCDLIWLGGLPTLYFKYDDDFHVSLSKSASFGMIVSLNFAEKIIKIYENEKRKGHASADSFYNFSNFGDRNNMDNIMNILNSDKNKTQIFDLLYLKQFLYKFPLVCEHGELTSDNMNIKTKKNKDRKTCESYVKNWIQMNKKSKFLNECENYIFNIKHFNT